MVSRLLLAVALLFTLESLAQAQESRTESATVTFDQSVHFIAADGSSIVIDPGQYLVEVAEEWLRLIPGERRDALLLKALPTAHQEAVTQPMARFITREEAQYSLVLLLPDGKGMEALGSATGVRSRAVKRGRVARGAPAPRKNIPRRASASTKPIPPSPTMTQQVQSLVQQVNTLQATIVTLQQTVTSLNSRLGKIEGGIQVASNGNITIGHSGTVTLQGSSMVVNTALVDVNAGVSTFSGQITAPIITTDMIVSKAYTPGAGNIW